MSVCVDVVLLRPSPVMRVCVSVDAMNVDAYANASVSFIVLK